MYDKALGGFETPEPNHESQQANRSCPNCGEPLSGITTKGPQTHVAAPCGCDIRHSLDLSKSVATDGGQVPRNDLQRAIALWIETDLPSAEKPVLAMDTDAGENVGFELGASAAMDLRRTVVEEGVVPDPGEHEFETKAVRVTEETPRGRTFLMLTRFRGAGSLLGENGWVGEYIQYQVMSRKGQRGVCGTDPFDLCRRHPAGWFEESVAAALMQALDMGHIDWEQIQDGDKLARGDVDRLADSSTRGKSE